MKIPKHIKRRLAIIENHQWKVKEQLSAIEKWTPALEDITDDENGWVFRECVDLQGAVKTATETEALLVELLAKATKEVA